jgi:predicted nucleic acid-binding protein
MYTIDASVWINSFDGREQGHETSRQLIELFRDNNIAVLVPNLLFIEIGGAIRRRFNNQNQAELFTNTVRNQTNIAALPLDDETEQQATSIAIQQGLRGADAVYVAVAIRHQCTLVSLDNEHLTRLVGVVETRTPADLLAELTPPQEQDEL